MKTQVTREHYKFGRYVRKKRWMSYHYQLDLIYKLNPKTILEIGIGNNFLKKQLCKDFNITTLDFDKSLEPDIVGNVTNIPLKDNSFDLVVCFQVLEHLPFKYFKIALREIKRVSKKNVIISLPYAYHEFLWLSVSIAKKERINFSLTVPRFYESHEFNGEHYWEIGKKGYPLKHIKGILKKFFIIKKTINPFENKGHVFFILEKTKD